MKPGIPSQKEIDEVIHIYMNRGWDRYRKKALHWLPEECEHMREDIEELLSQAFHQGGIAAGEGLQAVLEMHLARVKKATGSPAPAQNAAPQKTAPGSPQAFPPHPPL